LTKTMTGYLDLDDGKLYYEMAGDGDILVLGHAGFVDSRMWDAQGDTARASELQIRIWVDGPYHQPEQINPRVRQHAAEMNLIPVSKLCRAF
jgi:hypothetical protein